MTPYRTLAPAETAWIPRMARPGRVATALLLADAVGGATIWYASAAVWTWIGVLAAVLVQLVTWHLLHARAQRPVALRQRVARMERRCPHASAPCDSPVERRLAAAFQRAGLVVYPQHVAATKAGLGAAYHIDFAYYEAHLGLCIDIEVDAEFKVTEPDQLRRLEQRDAWFTRAGWHVLRFYASDCRSDPHACVQSVLEYIAAARRSHTAVLNEVFGALWLSDAAEHHATRQAGPAAGQRAPRALPDATSHKTAAEHPEPAQREHNVGAARDYVLT